MGHETWCEWSARRDREPAIFMVKFRKLGFIDYANGNSLMVHSALLSVVVLVPIFETTS